MMRTLSPGFAAAAVGLGERETDGRMSTKGRLAKGADTKKMGFSGTNGRAII